MIERLFQFSPLVMLRSLLLLTALVFASGAASAQIINRTVTVSPGTISGIAHPNSIQGQIANIDYLSHASISIRPVSGSTAGRSEDIRANEGFWLQSIAVVERNNRPCGVGLGQMIVSSRGSGKAYSSKSFGCRSARDEIMVRTPEQDQPPYQALTSLRVCQQNLGDRVKGLSAEGVNIRSFTPPRVLLGGAITPNVSLAPGSTPLEGGAERRECDTWATPSTCTAGEVIIGVRMHYDENRRGPEIKGLSAICARLDVTALP